MLDRYKEYMPASLSFMLGNSAKRVVSNKLLNLARFFQKD